jgi:hypothetical protein
MYLIFYKIVLCLLLAIFWPKEYENEKISYEKLNQNESEGVIEIDKEIFFKQSNIETPNENGINENEHDHNIEMDINEPIDSNDSENKTKDDKITKHFLEKIKNSELFKLIFNTRYFVILINNCSYTYIAYLYIFSYQIYSFQVSKQELKTSQMKRRP